MWAHEIINIIENRVSATKRSESLAAENDLELFWGPELIIMVLIFCTNAKLNYGKTTMMKQKTKWHKTLKCSHKHKNITGLNSNGIQE